MRFRCFFCAFLSLFFALICIPVSAEVRECSFELSDAKAYEGRNFQITFSACSKENIASFVADFTYDTEYLQFVSCKANDDCVVETNASEGKATLVFLCENGIKTENNDALFSLTFKAVSTGTCQISAELGQVINTDYEDVKDIYCKSSRVEIISSKPHTDNPSDQWTDVQIDEDSSDESSGDEKRFVVKGQSLDIEIIVFAALSLIMFACVIGITAYQMGKKQRRITNDKEKRNDNEK